MSTVIALVGRKGSGKSTLAKAIQELDPEFRVCSFATPLKAMGVRLFGMDPECVFGPSAARETVIPGSESSAYWQQVMDRCWADRANFARMLPNQGPGAALVALANVLYTLQAEAATLGGVTVRRVLELVGTDWGRAMDPDLWVNELLGMLGNADKVVVDDARFPNEARAVQARRGLVFYVDAGNRLPPRAPDAHASEPRPEDFARLLDGVLDTSWPEPSQAAALAAMVLRSVNR